MIRIVVLTGPYAGQVRVPPAGAEPVELFADLVRHGLAWEVDYSAGTEEEVISWFRAELIARVVRALRAGRPVKFLDQVYRTTEGNGPMAVAQSLEDAIVVSNRLVTIDSDDESGLVIGVRGYEAM